MATRRRRIQKPTAILYRRTTGRFSGKDRESLSNLRLAFPHSSAVGFPGRGWSSKRGVAAPKRRERPNTRKKEPAVRDEASTSHNRAAKCPQPLRSEEPLEPAEKIRRAVEFQSEN